jgi:predicted signal transduction protein with EAL and GGDEF domain
MWSIATVCLGGTLEAKLQAATRAGFRAVEIFITVDGFQPINRRQNSRRPNAADPSGWRRR